MRDQRDIGHGQQRGIDRRLALEDVEAGPGDSAAGEAPAECRLVDDLTPGDVDQVAVALHQSERGVVDQVVRLGRQRAVDRDDVDPGQHRRQRRPVRRLDRGLGGGRQAVAVVVVDRTAEGAGAAGDRLTDASHADDAQPLAGDAVAEQAGRRPAGPVAGAEQLLALADPPRDAEDQRHDHVGGVVGQHARGVGHDDVPGAGGGQVDVVDAGAEVGEQLQPRPGRGNDVGGDVVADRRHDDVGAGKGVGEPVHIHRDVVEVQLDVEQLGHTGLDHLRQAAGDNDLGARRHRPRLRSRTADDKWHGRPRRATAGAMLSTLLAIALAAPAAAPAALPRAAVIDIDATKGLSGLPVPRFVNVKSDKAYLRSGPGDRYPVLWVYVRKGLPVEIVREYGIWRQVRDIGGSIGWMNKQLIGGTRTAVVIGSVRTMYGTPNLQAKAVWRIAPGAIVRVVLCSEAWCRVDRGGKSGYILRAQLWGVSPTETIG